MSTVSDFNAPSTVFWQADASDARGNVIQATLGNGLQTIRGFDEVTGLPDYLQSGPGGSATLQDLELRWNKVGSLTQRKDVKRLLTEDFFYDDLHRLDRSELNGVQNLDLSYDPMGNILTKSDVAGSTWSYHATKKHAVVTAGSHAFTYDLNGNQATRNGQPLTWTSANYPSHVPNGAGGYHDYFYAADRQRWKQVYNDGSLSQTTHFVGGILEKHSANGVTQYRHTIYAGEQPVALYTRPSTGTVTTRYFLLDHLGSVAEITNSLGALDVPGNFAAFGERRDAGDWSGPPSPSEEAAIHAISQRGYTFHTNSEESSLIHMNGRIADALTGRFLSADPYVFEPHLTQSFNRYSYVRNNPLTFTDPSGFDPVTVGVSVVGTLWSFGKKLFGKKERPPPKGCFTNVGGTGCYGKAFATKLFDIARDIYGLPRLGAPPVWGVGEDRFGTGTCSFSSICMSLDDATGSVSPAVGVGDINVRMLVAYREYLFRAAIAGRDSKFALEPLVKSGALRVEWNSPIVPQDDFTLNALHLQFELELTGDTSFPQYEGAIQALLLSSTLTIPAGFGHGAIQFGSVSAAMQAIGQGTRIMRVETTANALTLMNIAGNQGFAIDTVSAAAYQLWLAENRAAIAAAIIGLEASK